MSDFNKKLTSKEVSFAWGIPVLKSRSCIAALQGADLTPAQLVYVYRRLPNTVARVPNVIEAFLSHQGADVTSCIRILDRSLKGVYLDDVRDHLAGLTEHTRKANQLLEACPQGLPGAVKAPFAWAAIGLAPHELEIYTQLVMDRAWCDDPWAETVWALGDEDLHFLAQSAEAARALVAA